MLSSQWFRSIGGAFLYWMLLLLALEPGNVQHALSMGHGLAFDEEALRIGVAALLGGSTAPLILALSRRFPIAGTGGWRRIALHAASAAILSLVLIVVSCFLAAWFLTQQVVPTIADIRTELAGNWLLVTFALCVFAAISQAMNLWRRSPASESRPVPARTIAVKTRGRLGYLDLASIEWIESQGNYLALHVGGRSHLVRETLQNFAGRLDPDRFIRVHRRAIVAIDRIREIRPLANGDSTLILQDGQTVRASRSYRETVRKRWAEFMTQA